MEKEKSPLWAAFICMALLNLFLGLIVMLLWNFSVAETFYAPSLGYWQACALLALFRLVYQFGTTNGG